MLYMDHRSLWNSHTVLYSLGGEKNYIEKMDGEKSVGIFHIGLYNLTLCVHIYMAAWNDISCEKAWRYDIKEVQMNCAELIMSQLTAWDALKLNGV